MSSDTDLFTWLDTIPLSRPKKQIHRDFSDAVLLAEIIHHYIPKLVSLHSYPAANGVSQKGYNWETLNQKVLKKLGMALPAQSIEDLSTAKPGAIEDVLQTLHQKIERYLTRHPELHTQTYTHPSSADSFATYQSSTVASAPTTNFSYPVSPQYVPSPQHSASSSSKMKRYSAEGLMYPPPLPTEAYALDARSAIMSEPSYPQQPVHDHERLSVPDLVEELQETIAMFRLKTEKLEELVRLKDERIRELEVRLRANGLE
ncbi:hypothetical protein BC832DRAFT_588860 [Gaertneriomyces semiglobifer]|nr:hypothetical protein BC832DRAFT_588860 [Gaertneriomyces semiglobifer]